MRIDVAKVRQDFGRAAATYDTAADLQRDVLHRLVAPYRHFFSQEARVLDAGCGTGSLLKWLKMENYAPLVVPLDIAFGMCQAAGKAPASTVNANMESLCFRDGSFDIVISSLAMQWVNNAQEALREFRRVLKPGGTLLLSSFGARTLHELKTAFSLTDSHVHVSPFRTVAEYQRMAHEAGFRVEISGMRLHRRMVGSLQELMRDLKALGAGNKWEYRRKGLTTPRQHAQVEKHYRERFAQGPGLPVTWEIIAMECSV